jgi:SAM-dependent methyltransferase
LQHVCYHNFQRLSPIILAKQPLLDEKKHDPGTFISADTAEGQKLFSDWRNNAEIQETIRSLNDIASVIAGDVSERKHFSVAFPTVFLEPAEQDKESFVLNHNGHSREIRVQDYDSIFSVPDLYEEVIHKKLECNSPSIIASFLNSYFSRQQRDPHSANVLELGAGNGIVAEALRHYGFRRFYGIDRSLVAAAAAQRDRPGLYQSYAVANLGHPVGEKLESLSNFSPSLLLAVSCLGFSDAGVTNFLSGLTYIKGGIFMVTLRDRFLDEEGSDFRKMFEILREEGYVQMEEPVKFVHRKSTDGRPIYYYALMGRMVQALTEKDSTRIDGVLSVFRDRRRATSN